jgi:hypothetical protein
VDLGGPAEGGNSLPAAPPTTPESTPSAESNLILFNIPPRNWAAILTGNVVVNDNHDTRSDVWDMDIESVKPDPQLPEVRLRAINIGDEPAFATFVDPKSPKLSAKYWKDDEKEVQYQVLWSKQLAAKEKWEQTFYVEGIKNSDILGDVVWEGDITPGKPAYPNYVSVYQVDLDVDSDNNGSIDGDAEDRIERSTDPMHPGKVIIREAGKDSDSDGVPDFADGFGLNPVFGAGTSGPCGGPTAKLVPMKIELKEPIDLKTAKVTFAYGLSASIPRLADAGGDIVQLGDEVTGRSYHLNKTGLRIWAVDAPERDGRGQTAQDVTQPEGKFVPPDTEIEWSQLAIANGESPTARVLTLYVEHAFSEPMGGLPQIQASPKTLIDIWVRDENFSNAYDGLFISLLPFELNSDLNNDGKAGEGADSSLKSAALQSGASNDAKEKGTEYLFVNDQFSNGLWDKEDTDSSEPAAESKDDDVTELKTICAATWGGIWFELEGGDISKLEFWKNKECTEAFTFDPTFALSESNKLPEKLYVRTKGEWTGQVEGKLIMKFGKPDKTETWAEAKLLFTVVKWVGDPKFFHACRDYILENNTKFYATQKDYGGEKMRTVVMRQEATSMKAQDTFYRTPKLRGIDAVVGAFSGQAVIVNGNFGASVSLVPPAETEKCLGRLISGGALDTSMSLDSTQSSSVFASSNAYYVAQSGSTFTFAKGEVPLTAGYQEALGGLYRDYPSAESDASTMIGQAPVGDKKVIFVSVTDMNTSSSGAGNGVIGFKDDATTGSGATEVYLLDGSSSSALAYQKPDGTLTRQFKGSKHDTPLAFPYYIHTYWMFECAKPRSN